MSKNVARFEVNVLHIVALQNEYIVVIHVDGVRRYL
jgi:hypothetical protein